MFSAAALPDTVSDLLRLRAQELPDKDAFRFASTGQAVTYAKFYERVRRLASGLRGLGVEADDRIAVMLPNRLEFIEAWFGATYIGALQVPVNTSLKGGLFAYLLNDCGCRTLVIDGQYVDRLLAIADDLHNLQTVLVCGDLPDAQERELNHRFTVMSFADVAKEQPLGASPAERAPWDAEGVIYTSGTTGPSKGALVAHRHRLVMAQDFTIVNQLEQSDILYTPFPFFHALATTLGILPMMLIGGTTVIAERFSASAFWDDIRASEATYSHTIFSLPAILLQQPPGPRDRNHKVRGMYTGPSTIASAFRERFGAQIVEIWGSGESGILTYPTPGDVAVPPGSCGRINPRYEGAVVDENDFQLPAGAVGEMVVRPREPWTITLGYLNKPEATLEATRNCWFRLGDNGYRDEQGNYYFVDRKKDSLRRRGENISSYEVEQIVNQFPGVAESAAVGVASGFAKGDQDIMVHVVPTEGGSVDPVALIEHCSREAPYFMVPRYIFVREALPKTPTQKILKHVLRDEGVPEGAFDRGVAGIKVRR